MVMINQRKDSEKSDISVKWKNKDDRWLCTILSYCLLKTRQTTTLSLSPLLGETLETFHDISILF